MFTVYVLKNKIGRIYIGQTKNLVNRLILHNSGRNRSTKNKGSFCIVYTETYESRAEAMKRERELKGGKGREWIRQQMWCK